VNTNSKRNFQIQYQPPFTMWLSVYRKFIWLSYTIKTSEVKSTYFN